MRLLLLALLIALLPVRGWVGNAMAVDMAAQRAASATQPSPMPADCTMHAQAPDQAGNTSQQAESGTLCANCDTCQLCLALASFTWTDPATRTHAAHSGPIDTGIRFSSADSDFSLKPPIF